MTEGRSDAALQARAEHKLVMARTRLLLDHPFLGALALRLPLKAAGSWCQRSATDARHIYYNAAWIDALQLPQVQFVLGHEALHCALRHFARRGHRVLQRWDLACDFAINPLLVSEGFLPPLEALTPDLYPNLCAEEIYPHIDETSDQQTMDQHLADAQGEGSGGQPPPEHTGHGSSAKADPKAGAGAGRPLPLSSQEREQLAQQWQKHLASALQHAQEAGQQGNALLQLMRRELGSRADWRSLLAGYLHQIGREDSSWARPARRETDFMLPARHQHYARLAVAIDSSGSISAADLDLFLVEINAIKGCLPIELSLLACDAALMPGCPWKFEPWEALCLPAPLRGGGGTRFTPVFEHLSQHPAPDALIYFTDALGEFPCAAPPYPVLWLVKGAATVPWGLRLQLS